MELNLVQQLPLISQRYDITFSEETISLFCKALRSEKQFIPPTLAAVGMKGIFEILNTLQVDWKMLRHVSQSFSYETALPLNELIQVQSQLMECRQKAGKYWLKFMTTLRLTQNQKLLLTSHSRMMV